MYAQLKMVAYVVRVYVYLDTKYHYRKKITAIPGDSTQAIYGFHSLICIHILIHLKKCSKYTQRLGRLLSRCLNGSRK